jgi:hypothetical protein
MKRNLIKTDNYLLVVDDSEIKEVDWYLTTNTNHIAKATESITPKEWGKKIISHAPLNGAPYLDGVDDLPPMGNDEKDDIEVLANKMTNHLTFPEERREGIVCGYNKAREKYEFTKEDMRKAIIMSSLSTVDFLPDRCDVIIQTIQQPKYPIAFEYEMITRVYDVYPQRTEYKPKTTINAEGRTEWVGKYIYN